MPKSSSTSAPTLTFTPQPTQTLRPTATPRPTQTTSAPGVVSDGKWKVAITGAHEESYLRSATGSYTPKSGYTFLVVDMTFRNLASQDTTVSSEEIAILSEDGKIFSADGGGNGIGLLENYCLDCFTTSTSFQGLDLQISFVFILTEAEINQTFRLQFRDLPLISFSLKDASQWPNG